MLQRTHSVSYTHLGYKSIGEPKELEEEIRLCYVGITRAKNNLYLTCSRQRTMFGSTSCNPVSRFVKEIPENMLEGSSEIDSEPENKFKDSNYEWSYGKSGNNGKVVSYKVCLLYTSRCVYEKDIKKFKW